MATTSVAELGTILSVWAHPDDEGYCCGAMMAEAVALGQRVVCVTATRGELGSTDPHRWPPGEQLADVRTKEMAKSLAELGVTEHIWLDYPDAGCADVETDAAADRLRTIIDMVQPDSVLTFGPDGGTFHPDHMAVSRWVSTAVTGTNVRVYHQVHSPAWVTRFFELVDPAMVLMGEGELVSVEPEDCAFYVEYSGELLEQKYRAMLCQESQVGPLLSLGGPPVFKSMIAEEAFTLARS